MNPPSTLSRTENDDAPLTPDELALAVKVFGTLAKWKRERLERSTEDCRTLVDDSNRNEFDSVSGDMAK